MAIIKRIENCTRVLGKQQGYIGLPIRDVVHYDAAQEKNVNFMLSAWELTPDELFALVHGGTLILSVMGTSHPPVNIHVETRANDEA